MIATAYPELLQFFAGYFHQDWAFEGESPDDVVVQFMKTRSAVECAQLSGLIDSFTAGFADDDELEHALFQELSCFYDPRLDSQSAREWLGNVSARLRAYSESVRA